jgi:hypothetical protein
MADLLYLSTMTFATEGGTWPAGQVRRIPAEDMDAWAPYITDGTIVAAGAAPSDPTLPAHSFGESPDPVDVTPELDPEPEVVPGFNPPLAAPEPEAKSSRKQRTKGASAGAGQPTIRTSDTDVDL